MNPVVVAATDELAFAPISEHSASPCDDRDKRREAIRSVSLNRIIIGFIQPLLALLLMAGMAQAEPCLFDDNDRARIIERTLDAASILADDASQAEQAASNETGEDHGPEHALLPGWAEIVLDRARLIETGRAAWPTAPPSHRPCAAPPTGPPLV